MSPGRPLAAETRRALAVFHARSRELLDAEDVAEDARLPVQRARRALHNLSRRAYITHVGGHFFALKEGA